MNNLHYDIDELQQQYTIYCQVLDQYTNQIEDKLSELKSFVEDDTSTSATLSVLKENVNRQVITNLEKIIEIFSQIKLKLNQVKEYYLSCCGEMSLNENDLIDNIKCVKQIISYYEDLEQSLHLTPEVNAQQDVAQILDQLHQLNNLYQNKIDSMYEFEQTIAHMFDNEIEELREIQFNMSELKALGVNDLISNILLVNSTVQNINTPPKLEDFKTYDEYLSAVGEYAISHGYANKIDINGVTYYEFHQKFNFDYYGKIKTGSLTIMVSGDVATPYFEYDGVPIISIPNGLLVCQQSPSSIDDKGNYIDFFEKIFSSDCSSEGIVVDTITEGSANFPGAQFKDPKKGAMIISISHNLNNVENSDLVAHGILQKKLSERGIFNPTEQDFEDIAGEYIPSSIENGKRKAYFAAEIEMHADGVECRSYIAQLGRLKYVFGVTPEDGGEKMYVDDYIEAMSVADIGKPEKENDRKYSEQGVIENHYLGGHLEK